MIRRLRLLPGLVMLAYVAMHLANHAVGLISLKAMEDVLWYIFRIWTNRPAQLLLYSSFLVHYTLALYALWQRRTRMAVKSVHCRVGAGAPPDSLYEGDGGRDEFRLTL
jgi:hypothetical protein